MSIFMTILVLVLASWTSKFLSMSWITTLLTSFLTCVCLVIIIFFLYWWPSLFLIIIILLVVSPCEYFWLFVSCLALKCFLCFLLNLLSGNSVHWWCIRLIWAACGPLATCLMCLTVVLELSIFLVSCLALLAGNFLRSILLSLMVLKQIPHL